MIDDLKAEWAKLPAKTRAAVRTAWQTTLAAVGLFVMSALNVLREVVAGGTVDIRAELIGSGRILGDAVLVALAGVVAYVMNRNSGISYGEPGEG